MPRATWPLRHGSPSIEVVLRVHAVGVPRNPHGFEGIAGVRFLNRFAYGNFGNPAEFGLET